MAAATSALSVRDLRSLQAFLERECVWRLVAEQAYHREYRAVCTKPVDSSLELLRTAEPCLCCGLILLRPNDGGRLLCLYLEGRPLAQFRCSGVKRRRCLVEGFEPFYVLTMDSSLTPASGGCSRWPAISAVPSTHSASGVTPKLLYDHCTLVGSEERAAVAQPAPGRAAPICVGVGAWVVRDRDELSLYTYVLAYDLYAACCDRSCFPSLVRLFAETVYCGRSTCALCRDHGRHVDPAGCFVGTVPDGGVCFCYTPCRFDHCPIVRDDHVPFFTDCEDEDLTLAIGRQCDLRQELSELVLVRDRRGQPVPFKEQVWQLVKLDPGLSRLIVVSCPVLKRLALRATAPTAASGSGSGSGSASA
ncbi:T94 [Tupaiid betaherpesvirus 1]|uniref:T94 n=1 Tax=Tupaiid herpesvirus 1 (strain 1) TaxID=10397 RepID=Q997C7_TUHV1|nr:T94 [Tupaiid betaherpesvirus 1]AAK00702.1 T94 protein [Tupaiid betaherpesvirus 1]AAK57137.1 T94 [Tupaiid betaherpesvirus 1]